MFNLIKQVIESKDYKLEDMLYKINKMYLESYITEQEKTELDNLAREYANPINSYAPIQKQIDNLYIKISDLEDRVKLLEKTEEPGEEEEYPEFIQPTGAHDCYNMGDKIFYNGKKYICKMIQKGYFSTKVVEKWVENVDRYF